MKFTPAGCLETLRAQQNPAWSFAGPAWRWEFGWDLQRLQSTTTPHSVWIFWLFPPKQAWLLLRELSLPSNVPPKGLMCPGLWPCTSVTSTVGPEKHRHNQVQLTDMAKHVLRMFFKLNYFYSLIRKSHVYLQLAKTCLNKQQPQASERSANSQSKITAAPSMCHINVGMLIVYL